jgi:dihydroneopterin aldolase
MGKINLKNIKLYAYHGCLQEEAKIGSEYVINLSVATDLTQSAKSDLLADTVDYVHLNRIVKEEMAIRSDLLEHVAQRIIDRTLQELNTVQKIKISVAKVNPPIGGNVENVEVVMKGKQKK